MPIADSCVFRDSGEILKVVGFAIGSHNGLMREIRQR